MVNPLLERLRNKNCRKKIKKEFRIEKVIKRKGDKLYVKWKGYNNSLNSWINKKDPVKKSGRVNTFLSSLKRLEEILMFKLIFQIICSKN